MGQIEIKYASYSISELEGKNKELVEQAFAACGTSYAPYSNFNVGAAALLDDGTIITASNQESEVFPSGMCAERCLLYRHQATQNKIVALAIASSPSERECYPCGACRQVIVDTQNRQQQPIRVIMAGAGTATIIDDATLLLPFTFKL
ncbi:MAG: cytidine deaminase [Rikenellaceae bacterium]